MQRGRNRNQRILIQQVKERRLLPGDLLHSIEPPLALREIALGGLGLHQAIDFPLPMVWRALSGLDSIDDCSRN